MELKNLVSLRLLLMPPRLVVTECEPGNATGLNRRPWGSGHSGSGGLLLRPPSCAGVRAATKVIPSNIWGKPVLKSRYGSVCGAQAESSTSFPRGNVTPSQILGDTSGTFLKVLMLIEKRASGYGAVTCRGFSHWHLARLV